jgi:hypothetical protein
VLGGYPDPSWLEINLALWLTLSWVSFCSSEGWSTLDPKQYIPHFSYISIFWCFLILASLNNITITVGVYKSLRDQLFLKNIKMIRQLNKSMHTHTHTHTHFHSSVLLGIEPRTLYMLGKYSKTDLYSQMLFFEKPLYYFSHIKLYHFIFLWTRYKGSIFSTSLPIFFMVISIMVNLPGVRW